MIGEAVSAEDIKRIYDASPLPAAAVDDRGNILYRNPAFSAELDGLCSADPQEMLLHTGRAYDKYITVSNKGYRAYITPYEGMSAAVLIPCREHTSETLRVVCAAVRHASDIIGGASDDIYHQIDGEADGIPVSGIVDRLNSIELARRTLISEIRIPETIRLLGTADPDKYPPVSISEAAERLAGTLRGVFIRQSVGISVKAAAGMFARVDVNALKLIFMSFISSCMEREYFMDGIGITLARKGLDRMTFSVACSYISKRDQSLASSAVIKPSGYDPSAELIRLIGEKFGCTADVSEEDGWSRMSIEIGCAEPPDVIGLGSPVSYYDYADRYSDENVMLSRFGINNFYR